MLCLLLVHKDILSISSYGCGGQFPEAFLKGRAGSRGSSAAVGAQCSGHLDGCDRSLLFTCDFVCTALSIFLAGVDISFILYLPV